LPANPNSLSSSTIPNTHSTVTASIAAVTVPIRLGDRSYEIVISSGQLGRVGDLVTGWYDRRGLSRGGRRTALVVTDEHVVTPHGERVHDSLIAAGWVCDLVALPPGEGTKCQGQAGLLWDRLIALQADRNSLVVAVGGGVIGDLAGFVAATYARGIPFVQVPTTLLAQVDSSVGGKVGINHPRAKNMIGAFHQPLGVCIDTDLLMTLPDREYRAGLAEVVKYGVILDARFFEQLEATVAGLQARSPAILRDVVAHSCRLKATVTEQDEFERTGQRAALNYGHTFAHAFEALVGYGELLHGEAVAIGMVCASRLAERLGRVDSTVTARQVALLEQLGLPTRIPARPGLENAAILAKMQLDKKTVGGALRFVLPSRLGAVELVSGVPGEAVTAVLGESR